MCFLAGTTTDWNVPESASYRPVALTVTAEMSWLVYAVVIIVAEFGVHGLATRARDGLHDGPLCSTHAPAAPSAGGHCTHELLGLLLIASCSR